MSPLALILLNTLLFTVIFGSFVWFSLWWNIRVWIHDFPQPMQDAIPPLSPYEKRQQAVCLVLMLLVMIPLPMLLNAQLRAAMGTEFTFFIAYAQTWLMLQAANLYDAVGVDLPIALKPPKFTIAPGTEPYLYLLLDPGMHVRNFLKGLVMMSVWALPLAVVAVL